MFAETTAAASRFVDDVTRAVPLLDTSVSTARALFERSRRAMTIDTPFLAESWKMPRRLHNLIRLMKDELKPRLAQSPCEEVAHWGRVRLLRYATTQPERRCPVLMIPSIINKYYVLDLRPGQSFVEYLSQQGIPVYMLDWGDPGPQDRYATMEDHILRWQGAAVRAACKHAGVSAIHMLGYCVGGTFAIAYAALRPQRVAGLIALTAPVNFHDEGILSVWATDPNFDVDRLAETYGLIPAELLQSSFSMMDPLSQKNKMTGLWEKLWNDGFVENFLALETWLNDNVDFPGATYTRHIKELYRENQLVKGEFTLGGETVRLGDITCPVLTVISTKDHIVPGTSASQLHDLVGSDDRTFLPLPGGHIGVTVGSKAKDGLWKSTAEWLTARPCPARQ